VYQQLRQWCHVILREIGGNFMPYETKVILLALAEIAKKAESAKEIYDAIAKIANVEGIVIEPYDEVGVLQ